MNRAKKINLTILLAMLLFPFFLVGCDFFSNIFAPVTITIDDSCVGILSVNNYKARAGETVVVGVDETYIVDAIYVNNEVIEGTSFTMPEGKATLSADIYDLRINGAYVCVAKSYDNGVTIEQLDPTWNEIAVEEGDNTTYRVECDHEAINRFVVKDKTNMTYSMITEGAETLFGTEYVDRVAFTYTYENNVITPSLDFDFNFEMERQDINNLVVTIAVPEYDMSIVYYFRFIKDLDLSSKSYNVSVWTDGYVQFKADGEATYVHSQEGVVDLAYIVEGDVITIIVDNETYVFTFPKDLSKNYGLVTYTDLQASYTDIKLSII